MTNFKRFSGISAAAFVIAASFATVTASPSFAADRSIGVVAKKRVKVKPVFQQNDKIVNANTNGGIEQPAKKNFKFLVKDDKPSGNDNQNIQFVAPEDKPVAEVKPPKRTKRNNFILADDKPEDVVARPKRKKRTEFVVAEDKPVVKKPRPRIASEDKFDNGLGFADLADATDEPPVKKVKITGKKKVAPPPVEDEADETAETRDAEPKEAVEDPDTEEKQAAEEDDTEEPAPVVKKKKKVAKKKVIEPVYEDDYAEYDSYEGNYEYDNGGYNQSYGVSYSGGYSSCH